jgi:hypothetical protein
MGAFPLGVSPLPKLDSAVAVRDVTAQLIADVIADRFTGNRQATLAPSVKSAPIYHLAFGKREMDESEETLLHFVHQPL